MKKFEKFLRDKSYAGRIFFYSIIVFYSYVIYKTANEETLFINTFYDNIIVTIFFFFTLYFCGISIKILKDKFPSKNKN